MAPTEEGTAPAPQQAESDLQRTRAALAARVDSCWDRLDDVVSELVALHEASPESIVRRVRRVIAAELAG